MKLKETYNSLTFIDVLKSIKIDFHEFSMHKCDERTFYITISIQYGKEKETCYLIFLLDRPNILGAISLNEKYDKIRHFFKKHFHFDLSYSDEQQIARVAMSTIHFQKCLVQFSSHYPKYISKIN